MEPFYMKYAYPGLGVDGKHYYHDLTEHEIEYILEAKRIGEECEELKQLAIKLDEERAQGLISDVAMDKIKATILNVIYKH